MRFTKMQGVGNDYVYVDLFQEKLPVAPEKLAPIVSNRHFGIGSDGLILICPTDLADARMRMFNPDGSESEMCGNAIRCVAKYVADRRESKPTELRIATNAGVLTLACFYKDNQVERVRVDMGSPILIPEQIPTNLRSQGEEGEPVVDLSVGDLNLDFSDELVKGTDVLAKFDRASLTCVSMGNPHCVIFVDELSDDLVLKCGSKIERSLDNFPNRVNVEFAKIVSRTEVDVRVWERGAGETLACGTGACAVAVASVLSGRTERNVQVRLPGGKLEIVWDKSSNHVFMTGPAVEVFTGDISDSFITSFV